MRAGRAPAACVRGSLTCAHSQAAAKLAAGKGMLDPTNMSITDVFHAVTGTGPA